MYVCFDIAACNSVELTWPATGVIPEGVHGDTHQFTCVAGFQLKTTEGNVTCQAEGEGADTVIAYDVPSDPCSGATSQFCLYPGHVNLLCTMIHVY